MFVGNHRIIGKLLTTVDGQRGHRSEPFSPLGRERHPVRSAELHEPVATQHPHQPDDVGHRLFQTTQ